MTSDVNSGRPGRLSPSWLPFGCPFWCVWGDTHQEGDSYDDRWHGSAAGEIVLTATDPTQRDDRPSAARMSLVQHYRERHPRIEIERDNGPTALVFTIDEAAEFARQLLELADIAHRSQGATTGSQPHQIPLSADHPHEVTPRSNS